MTPTARVAWVLGAVALLALVVPLWAAVAVALALLAVALADGFAVRRAPGTERAVGGVLALGAPTRLLVRTLARDRRRVLLRQPATPAFAVSASAAGRGLEGEIVPLRRGRHELPGVASASVGPLGLARWHHPSGPASELLVYPDLPAARRLAAHLRQGRAAPDGRLRRGPLGVGTDFESIRDYSPDDDVRHVNWRASARVGRAMSNQYRLEQDRDVVLMLDAGRLMTAPAGPLGAPATLLDAAMDAASAVAVMADALGDHCGAIAFDADVERVLSPRRLGGRRVVQALFDLQPRLVDSDFERAALRVGGARRALVLVFTDLVDEQAARSLLRATPMLARRHAVIVASVADAALEDHVAAAQAASGADTSAAMGGAAVEGARAGAAAMGGAVDAAADARALAALSVLEARERAARGIRRAGADVVLAPSRALPRRCVQAYLRAKARARL